MTASDLDHRLQVAGAVAREAGAVARERFRVAPEAHTHTFKSDQDYLTETDAELERLIRERLAAAFPTDSFFGEESGGTFGSNLWIVDPIDGTANFARGIPHFCVSIAFVRDRNVEIGVIYQPMTDEVYAARRGAGAMRNGQRIRVSAIADIRQSTVEAGWSTRLPPEPYVALVDRLIKAGAQVRRAGSGALALAYVADGRIDAYCELHINAWDALAGLLLIEEAGGWTNDFLAGDGLRRGNAVLGCTPALNDIVSRAMGLRPVDAAPAKG
jgi:myo-inositol-1(or 4)-monophosphatase